MFRNIIILLFTIASLAVTTNISASEALNVKEVKLDSLVDDNLEVVEDIVQDVAQVVEDTLDSVDDVVEEALLETAGDSLIITEAWARAPIPPNNNSAIYMKINNPTKKQITILGASAAVIANNVELHKSFVDEKGISRMTAIDKIVVPAESEIELKPGAIHIMLFDLKRRMIENSKFEVSLTILDSDPIISEVTVLNK